MRKPLIGLGADLKAGEGSREGAFGYLSYVQAIREAGGIPVLIPPQPENIKELSMVLDGVVLAGGDDCDPALFGEECHPSVRLMRRERQENDLALVRLAREGGVPALGICLGMQMMAIGAGGRLIQDIRSELDSAVRHESVPAVRARHDVDVASGSRLASIVGMRLNVNSSHHQAVRDPGDGMEITSRATDGIIEAIEDPRHPYFVGVQWHPEDMTKEASGKALFHSLIEAARVRASRRDGSATSE